MRILHAIAALPPAAGTTTFCREALRALADRGHDCHLWTPDGAPPPWHPDVLHLHALWTPWLLRPFLWAKRRGVPVVWSPHGMLAPWAMAHKRWKKILPWALYQRPALRAADLLHVTSPLEAGWVRDLGLRNPLAEVPLGVDLPPEPPPLPTRPHLALFVGRLHPIKGLDLLVRAWALHKRRDPATPWRLLLVGPDEVGYQATLAGFARGLGLSVQAAPLALAQAADLTFAGPLYGPDKAAALDAARLLILPSHTENFGGVILEALAHALPALASDATPWEILPQARCGDRFPLDPQALADALDRLAALPDSELEAMGRRGRELVRERYAWPAVADALARAYAGLLPPEGR